MARHRSDPRLQVSDTTLRTRRDEWITAGVFDQLHAEAMAAFDRIIELDLSEVSIDGSLHKAPYGGEGTGPNPTDRAKLGWKWSIGVDRHGVPVGWAIDGANRNDVKLLGPTIESIQAAGLLDDVDTMHLDRGYDYPKIRAELNAAGLKDLVIQRRRRPGDELRTTPPQHRPTTPPPTRRALLRHHHPDRREVDRLARPLHP